jgi:hypothetical protein
VHQVSPEKVHPPKNIFHDSADAGNDDDDLLSLKFFSVVQSNRLYKRKSKSVGKIEGTREMSSPGAVKVNRPVAPWPKVYHTSITSMFLSCSQMHKVFANRWAALHAPIMTVSFKLHPEFCRRDKTRGPTRTLIRSSRILPKHIGLLLLRL